MNIGNRNRAQHHRVIVEDYLAACNLSKDPEDLNIEDAFQEFCAYVSSLERRLEALEPDECEPTEASACEVSP